MEIYSTSREGPFHLQQVALIVGQARSFSKERTVANVGTTVSSVAGMLRGLFLIRGGFTQDCVCPKDSGETLIILMTDISCGMQRSNDSQTCCVMGVTNRWRKNASGGVPIHIKYS